MRAQRDLLVTMKLAHLSDPHLLDLTGVPWTTFLKDKRVSGFANLLFARARKHHADIAQALARHVHHDDVDHVAITGDFTNLALPREIDKALGWILNDLALPSDRVSIIPGNHDRYTREAVASGYLDRSLAPFMQGDDKIHGTTFPYLRLRGPLAIIGVDTAVPRPLFVAAGQVGRGQREALRTMLRSEEVRQRTPVLLMHHPPTWTRPWLREVMHGLRDVSLLHSILPRTRGLILHGHLHKTLTGHLRLGDSQWLVAGAPSASSTRTTGERAAGYNTYEFDTEGRLEGAFSTTLGENGATSVRALEGW